MFEEVFWLFNLGLKYWYISVILLIVFLYIFFRVWGTLLMNEGLK